MSRPVKKVDRSEHFFCFHDGVKDRKIDSIRAVLEIQKNIPLDMIETNMTNPSDLGKFVDVFRTVFSLPEYNEETDVGTTMAEVLSIAQDFLEEMNHSKKVMKPKPTLLNSTGQAS